MDSEKIKVKILTFLRDCAIKCQESVENSVLLSKVMVASNVTDLLQPADVEWFGANKHKHVVSNVLNGQINEIIQLS
jgi:hypothetical protein